MMTMGPTIILDKSSLQSLNAAAARELDRYFFLVLPPVLLEEILGDLTKSVKGEVDPEALVSALARKVPVTASGPSPNFRVLCVQDLMGNLIPTSSRRPILNEADAVFGDDGSYAVSHPEQSAVYRWGKKHFDESDKRSSESMRERAHATDWDAVSKTLPKLEWIAPTLEELNAKIDEMFEMPEGRDSFLRWHLRVLGCGPETSSLIIQRWKKVGPIPLNEFAPYAAHCLRVDVLFPLAMSMNLVGRRRSNIIDAEYLHYLPFAHVFGSGDGLHHQLVPFFQENDQSFVTRDELVASLNEMADLRKTDLEASPAGTSLISELWRKHLNCLPSKPLAERPRTEKELKEIRELSQSLLDALDDKRRQRGPEPRFPN